MTTLVLTAHVARSDNEVLRSADLVSSSARNERAKDRHRVRAGVRRGSAVTWLGEWDQSQARMPQGVPFGMLDEQYKGLRLKTGDQLVAEVFQVGSPASIQDATLNFNLELVGGRSGRERPLIRQGTEVGDWRTREALDGVASQIKSSGLGRWSQSVALVDPSSAVSVPGGAGSTYSSTLKTVATGSMVNGDVTVTVTPASGKTAKGVVQAEMSFESSSGAAACTGTVAINDGSTDQNRQQGWSGILGRIQNVATSYAFSVTAETTFTIRLQSTTSSARVQRQNISAMWVNV